MKNNEIFNPQTCSLIKKLSTVYKNGYVASRGRESYRYYVDDDGNLAVGDMANCFEHACFNLKNEHFVSLDLNPYETAQGFGKYGGVFNDRNMVDDDDIRDALFSIVKRVGLEYKLCSPNTFTKSNEWKVAFYLANDPSARLGYDFHFLLQEKNGSWSGKYGWYSNRVDTFDNAPTAFKPDSGLKYILQDMYLISNPYAETEKE